MWVRMATATGLFFYLLLCAVLSLGSTLLTGTLPLHPPWALIQEKTRVPQLLLYSRADDVVSHEDVEAFATARSSLGVTVVTHSWDDSAHVQHLRKYPEEYKDAVHSFLSLCLTSSNTCEEIITTPPTSLTSASQDQVSTFRPKFD